MRGLSCVWLRGVASVVNHPCPHAVFGGLVEQAALLPVEVGVGCLQVGAGLVDGAAARGGEGHDGNAMQVVALNERVDDGGCGVPPNGETQIDHVVGFDVLHLAGDGRTAARA